MEAKHAPEPLSGEIAWHRSELVKKAAENQRLKEINAELLGACEVSRKIFKDLAEVGEVLYLETIWLLNGVISKAKS